MRTLPTLRRELIATLALVFAGALFVAAGGVFLLLPRLETPAQAAGYVTLLIAADVVIFAAFGHALVKRRVLVPLERLVDDAEAIAEGDFARRIPAGETVEMARVAEAVNSMAGRLISHRGQLAANVRSLEETNRQLTEARDELIRAEKMASVGRLAAGIAHEVGNPLSALLGFIELMARCKDEQRRELADAAEREARRIDRIVRGLLDYARPREAAPRRVDVNAVVQESVDLLSTQGRFTEVALDLELGEGIGPVTADPHQLQQVLVNLIMNAIDAMADSKAPALTVRTSRDVHRRLPYLPSRRRDDPPDIDYSHRRRFHQSPRVPRPDPFPNGGSIVRIRVADTGPGIPADLLPQIFEPFVTTKEPGKGTGLGLAVAARLVDAMGGTILAESTDGGAAFTVTLPLRGVQETAASEPPEPVASP